MMYINSPGMPLVVFQCSRWVLLLINPVSYKWVLMPISLSTSSLSQWTKWTKNHESVWDGEAWHTWVKSVRWEWKASDTESKVSEMKWEEYFTTSDVSHNLSVFVVNKSESDDSTIQPLDTSASHINSSKQRNWLAVRLAAAPSCCLTSPEEARWRARKREALQWDLHQEILRCVKRHGVKTSPSTRRDSHWGPLTPAVSSGDYLGLCVESIEWIEWRSHWRPHKISSQVQHSGSLDLQMQK